MAREVLLGLVLAALDLEHLAEIDVREHAVALRSRALAQARVRALAHELPTGWSAAPSRMLPSTVVR